MRSRNDTHRKNAPKLRSALAAIACAVALVAGGAAWAVDYNSPNYGWYTANPDADTFQIRTAGELQAFSEIVGGIAYDDEGERIGPADFTGKTVRLANSVSLLGTWGYEFVPIGTPDAPFNGTFDGCGNIVSDMVVSGDTATEYAGLFGYCGSGSALRNVSIQDDCRVSIAVHGTQEAARYIGGLVGYTAGSISSCTSRAYVGAIWDDGNAGADRDVDHTEVVRNVGGVAGYAAGTLSDVHFTGTVSVYTTADATLDKREQTTDAIVARYVGGVAGEVGDLGLHPATGAGDIVDCTNAGKVTVTTVGDGGKDRFGEVVESKSEYLGGIAGFACGNVRNCSNSGDIRGTAYVPTGDAEADARGYDASAGGATSTGGIVGALRDGDRGAGDPIAVVDCTNLGGVFSLNNVGGIVGAAGSWTTITRCANGDAAKVRRDENVAQVVGTRWNKPCIGGIAGASHGCVTYCRNHGEVSTTDIGYYVGGVVGNLGAYADSRGNSSHPMPEVYGCYNTGQVECMQSYRRGAIVGGNGGYVHDCVYLHATATVIDGDFSAIGKNYGMYKNLEAGYASDAEAQREEGLSLKSKQAVAFLNGACSKDGWETYYLLAGNANAGYPVLLGEAAPATVLDLGSLSPAVALKADASYTAACNPEPLLDVTAQVGGASVQLVQNADFRVVSDNRAVDANGVCVGITDTGTAPYTCTLAGIGEYAGVADGTAYGIAKGDFSECSVLAPEVSYTGEAQNDPPVQVVDPSGGIVDERSYTYTVNDGNDCVDPASYTVMATARASSNYYGAARGKYVIDSIDIARECDTVGIVYGNRVWYYDEDRYQLYEVNPVLDADGNLTYHADTGFPVVEGETSYVNENGVTLSRATPKLRDADGYTVYGMNQTYTAGEINPDVIGVVWNGRALEGIAYDAWKERTAEEALAEHEALQRAWWQVIYGGGTDGASLGSAEGLKNIESSTTGAVTVTTASSYTRNYIVMNFDIDQLHAQPSDFAMENGFSFYAYNDGEPPTEVLNKGRVGATPFRLLHAGNVVDPANYELVARYSVDNLTGERHEGDQITYNAGDTVHYDVHFVAGGSIVCDDIEDAATRTIISDQIPLDEETFEVMVDSSPCQYNFDGCPAPVVTVRNKQTGEVLERNVDYTYSADRWYVGTWPLVVEGIGRYAGNIVSEYTVSMGVLESSLFAADGTALAHEAKIVNGSNDSAIMDEMALVFPWRVNGYGTDELESSLGIAWRLKVGYGLNGYNSSPATIWTNDGRLFRVSGLRDARGNAVDKLTDPGTYTIHLSHLEGADANNYGARYFDTADDFSLDVRVYVSKLNLSSYNYTTHPITGAKVAAYEYSGASLRLAYGYEYLREWPYEYHEVYNEKRLPYTGKPALPKLQLLDSTYIGALMINRGEEDFSAHTIPASEYDVEVQGFGTTGPTEVNDAVTNPYYVSRVIAKPESAYLQGAAKTNLAVTDLRWKEPYAFAIVPADISDADVVDVRVDRAVYAGEAVEPAVRFYVGGEECAYVRGEDYELEYANNVAAGSAAGAAPPTVRVRILNGNHLVAHDADGADVDHVDIPFDIEYETVQLADVEWDCAETNVLADAGAGVLEAAGIVGSYAHPGGNGERLAVPAGAYAVEAGTVPAASARGASALTLVAAGAAGDAGVVAQAGEDEAQAGSLADTFAPKADGWQVGDAVYYRISATEANPAFAGSVVVGPARVVAASAANSFASFGAAECSLALQPAEADGAGGAGAWSFAYTGTQVEPAVAVSDGARQLVEGRDYELSYGENVNAGATAGSVEVRGRGAYTGAYVQRFEIRRAKLSDCAVQVAPQTFAGKGRSVAPDAADVRVLLGDVELPAGDWQVDSAGYGANDGVGPAAGTLTVVSDGAGNLEAGSVVATFAIGRLGLSPARFDVAVNAAKAYDGAPQQLSADEISVTDTATGDVLEYGADYVLNYPGDSVSAGTVAVWVSGQGCYADSLTTGFSVAKADLSGAKIVLDAAYPYTGFAVRPLPRSVAVELPDGRGGTQVRTLEERYTTTTGETYGDYVLSYANNAAVATADAAAPPTLTITGVRNFTGRASATFAIASGVINDATTTVELPKGLYVYTGRAIEPAPTVRYNGRVLDEADYTVSYDANVQPGTATVTVAGTGANLTGTVKTQFHIASADLSKATVAPIAGQRYAYGEEVCPALTVTGETGERLVSGVDYVVEYADNTGIGTARAKVVPVPGSAYEGSVAATFKIVKIPIGRSDVRMSATEFVYDGESHRPEIRIVSGAKLLEEGVDYTLAWPADTVTPGGKAVDVEVPAGSVYSSQVTVVYYITDEDGNYTGGGSDAGGGTGSGGSGEGTGSGSGGSDAHAGSGADSAAAAAARAAEQARAAALAAATYVNKASVTAADVKRASDLGATEITLGPKVKKIAKNAFKGTKIKTIVAKTKRLKKKAVKNSLKGSAVKTVKVQVGSKKLNKKYVKAYKKIFTKKIAGKKPKVK